MDWYLATGVSNVNIIKETSGFQTAGEQYSLDVLSKYDIHVRL